MGAVLITSIRELVDRKFLEWEAKYRPTEAMTERDKFLSAFILGYDFHKQIMEEGIIDPYAVPKEITR